MKNKQRKLIFRVWDGKKMLYSFGYVRADNGNAVSWSEDEYKSWIVMQYTNLRDKNKKRIFEGDVVNVYNNRYYIKTALPFIELMGRNGELYDNGDYYNGGNILMHNWIDFEVIGNIYENPELIK